MPGDLNLAVLYIIKENLLGRLFGGLVCWNVFRAPVAAASSCYICETLSRF